MTHRAIETLSDGTRKYVCGKRYKPLSLSERVYGVRKPQDPRAVRWGGSWLLPLDLLPDNLRVRPETRPDSDAYDHMAKPRKCKCAVCKRPEAKRWQEKWRRDHEQVLVPS
jgi:hypothetical protein